MSTLILAAHPDDEVLGCGGTAARLVKEGEDVYIAILGEGISSRYDQRDDADSEQIEDLHGNSQEVADLLGAKKLFMYSLPDNRFDTVANLNIVKIIEELIEQLKPHTVYTQHGGDLNVDHERLYRATLAATRPMENHCVRAVYAYEVASSTEWAFQKFSPPFVPDTFVDISETLDVKVEAMELYESESRPFPHPRSPESLHAIAKRWGSTAGMPAAEAFQTVRRLV